MKLENIHNIASCKFFNKEVKLTPPYVQLSHSNIAMSNAHFEIIEYADQSRIKIAFHLEPRSEKGSAQVDHLKPALTKLDNVVVLGHVIRANADWFEFTERGGFELSISVPPATTEYDVVTILSSFVTTVESALHELN